VGKKIARRDGFFVSVGTKVSFTEEMDLTKHGLEYWE
jgi:hypothetical protein